MTRLSKEAKKDMIEMMLIRRKTTTTAESAVTRLRKEPKKDMSKWLKR